MSPETDSPRQRTVAELLAEHGGTGATGRRRRRREADGSDGDVAPPAPASGAAGATGSVAHGWSPAAPSEPDRAILREPVPGDAPPLPRRETESLTPRRETQLGQSAPWQAQPQVAQPQVAQPQVALPQVAQPQVAQPRETGAAALLGHRPPSDEARDRPTDKMPGIRDARPGVLDPGLTGPIDHQRPDGSVLEHDELDDGDDLFASPATSWDRATPSRAAVDLAAAGPPTQAGRPLLDFDDFDDHPAGLGDDDRTGEDAPPARRLGRTAAGASTGQAWMAVVAQWIIGAVGGAALWVGFRFLWRELPVVALAAAVLVTVGLVLVVRALLRNNDMRTTVFAVLVGLLLTVSPALLVLLGR